MHHQFWTFGRRLDASCFAGAFAVTLSTVVTSVKPPLFFRSIFICNVGFKSSVKFIGWKSMIAGQPGQVFLLMIDVFHVCFVLKVMLMIQKS